MSAEWTYTLIGIGITAVGAVMFFRNAFEEDRSIRNSVVLMILGVVVIVLGMSGYLR